MARRGVSWFGRNKEVQAIDLDDMTYNEFL